VTAYEYGKVDRFDQDDRVEVIDLASGDRHTGYVVADRGGDAAVTVRYDDGTLVRVGRGFVRRESAK
jgi:hypothetical protein